MKTYPIITNAEEVTAGKSYVMNWGKNSVFAIGVSGTFVGKVVVEGLTGDSWFTLNLTDATGQTTEITEAGVYLIATPKIFTQIRASVTEYTSGTISVTGIQTEGNIDVLAAVASL